MLWNVSERYWHLVRVNVRAYASVFLFYPLCSHAKNSFTPLKKSTPCKQKWDTSNRRQSVNSWNVNILLPLGDTQNFKLLFTLVATKFTCNIIRELTKQPSTLHDHLFCSFEMALIEFAFRICFTEFWSNPKYTMQMRLNNEQEKFAGNCWKTRSFCDRAWKRACEKFQSVFVWIENERTLGHHLFHSFLNMLFGAVIYLVCIDKDGRNWTATIIHSGRKCVI